MDFDYVVVGAGFAGSVCAERLARAHGRRVLVVERRGHVGGNAHDRRDAHGILVHPYGPHIFHTRIAEVWSYLSRFTEWRAYSHRVLGVVDGARVPLPFNLSSLHALFPRAAAERIEGALVRRFGTGSRVPILELQGEGDPDLKMLADYVYEKVFLHYSVKQWGLAPEELSPAVTGRVPVVVSRDDRYFSDPWQGLPADGYSAMFARMLAHPNIEVLLNTDYGKVAGELKPRALIYTGMVDEFFGARYGPLPYRSLEFRFENLPVASFQDAAVVNYPNDFAYTRITEYKKLTGQEASSTTIAYEYPRPRGQESDEPYYPIPRETNDAMRARYREEADRVSPAVRFVGRLAEYAYMDMDQTVASALRCVEELEGKPGSPSE
jgi:UDP-galactopyranose mutase